jgi:hypothetical protein
MFHSARQETSTSSKPGCISLAVNGGNTHSFIPITLAKLRLRLDLFLRSSSSSSLSNKHHECQCVWGHLCYVLHCLCETIAVACPVSTADQQLATTAKCFQAAGGRTPEMTGTTRRAHTAFIRPPICACVVRHLTVPFRLHCTCTCKCNRVGWRNYYGTIRASNGNNNPNWDLVKEMGEYQTPGYNKCLPCPVVR